MVGTTTSMSMVLDPPRVHEFMMLAGVKKAHMKPYKMILMGVMSGFYVMIGAHGMVSMLSGDEATTKSLTLLSGLVFSLALIGIIMVGGELFTGNCLLVVAVLSKRIRWWEMVVDWLIIYFSNFAGNIIFSVLLFGTGFYGWDFNDQQTPHGKTLCKLVHKKAEAPAYQIFFRGIFANFCVCLAVLLSWTARSAEGKIIAMVWPIAVFVVSGFEHCIANQGLFALATIMNCPTNNGWYWVNLSVSTPGNIIGAFILGIGYYFITIWGSDLSLNHFPKYAADGITICDYCKTPMTNSATNNSFVKTHGSFALRNGAPICEGGGTIGDPILGNCCATCSQHFSQSNLQQSHSRERVVTFKPSEVESSSSNVNAAGVFVSVADPSDDKDVQMQPITREPTCDPSNVGGVYTDSGVPRRLSNAGPAPYGKT